MGKQGWELADALLKPRRPRWISSHVCFAHPAVALRLLLYPLPQMSEGEELPARSHSAAPAGQPVEPQPGRPLEGLWEGKHHSEVGPRHGFFIVMVRTSATFNPSSRDGRTLGVAAAVSVLGYLIKLWRSEIAEAAPCLEAASDWGSAPAIYLTAGSAL